MFSEGQIDMEAAATDLKMRQTSKDEALETERLSLAQRYFVRRLQKGDPRAFRQLVQLHEDRVYSFVLRMLGDPQEAEDISQEVFLAVHRNLSRFRGDCRVSTWIYRVAKNHCLNRLKYLEIRASAGDVDLERAESSGDALGTAPQRPDQTLLAAEEIDQVQRALSALSPEHRLLVVMRDIEGLGYEQIAHVAQLPLGTVKSRIHRARAALADVLEAAGMVPDGARSNERVGAKSGS